MTSPQAVQDQITAYLHNVLGLGSTAIAGVEGNLQVESGFRPGIVNPKEGSIGLAQWEGGRRTNLQRFAASQGTTETDVAAQLGWLGAELQGPYSSVLAQLRAATSPAQAATIFDQSYERSAGTTRQARIDAATAIASGATVAGTGASSGASSGGSGAGSAAGQPASFLGLSLPSFTAIGHWILDGVVILAGVALIVAAFVLIAKGGDSDRGTTVTVDPTAGGHDGEGKGAGKGAASGAAEDAAVAA